MSKVTQEVEITADGRVVIPWLEPDATELAEGLADEFGVEGVEDYNEPVLIGDKLVKNDKVFCG